MRRIGSVCLVLFIAGCGGGGGSKSSDEASKSPSQIIADVKAALGEVKSFHIAGFEVDKDGRTTLDGDVALPGRMQILLHNKDSVVEFIVIPGASFIKANRAFWQSQGDAGKLAPLLGDKWVKVPKTAAGSLGQLEAITSPATIGHCMVELHLGKVVKAGTAKVGGKDTVVLEDKGGKPGSTPGKLYVQTSGPPLPVRATQTGGRAPGGKPDAVCHETADDVNDTIKSSDLTLGDYGKAVKIEAPAGAVDLNGVAGGSQA